MVNVKQDLSGLKFGNLTVIEQYEDYVSPKGVHEARWFCKCDCGRHSIVRSSDLKNKKTKSCGHCTDNRYDLSGEYGICTMAKGDIFLFDIEDYDLIKQYSWNSNVANGYIIGSISRTKKVYLHRLLMNPKNNETVDHINHLKYDNRKSNLRVCTQSQNNMNTSLRSDNSTGYKGVYKYSTVGKYIARIMIDGETIHLGCFDNIEDAVNARKEAEEKYFGEYAYASNC